MLDLWYKNAVVYCLDVETFMDSNGDGVGDLQGLADRLDHIESLGATCVWLLPFYPTPNRDNGYDVKDFYGVDPRLGTLGDFVHFAREARNRGLRVIVDLVANHTSIDHPWFQAARKNPASPYRDYYIWSKELPDDHDEGVIFPGVQESTWTYDEEAQAYYYHRFYAHQPDLDIANPAVQEEIEKIMGFWLELGVSGFRIDAVPFLIEPRPDGGSGDDPHHSVLTHLRRFLSWRKAEAVLLAEANIPHDEAPTYFGDGDRMTMVFDFVVNQATYLAFARGDARPLARALRARPRLDPVSHWATFLRNHDELDLGRLSDAEREEVFAAFAPQETMRIYDRGIRRRLAPMLGGEGRRLALADSLLLSLPGAPVLWYGEEIGMGDALELDERNSVRTPMQWTREENGGFSRAPAEKLVRPVVSDERFAPARVNVADQSGREGSQLERVRNLVRLRRACPEIGWGEVETLDAGDPGVLALKYSWRGDCLVTLHNFSDRDVEARLDLGPGAGPLRPLIEAGDGRETLDPGSPVPLPAHGYCWLRVGAERR